MDRQRLKYWLALGRVRGADRRGLKELVESCDDVGDIFKGRAPGAKLGQADWKWVDDETARIERAGVRCVTLNDPDYPALLGEIYDPPFLLYTKGSFSAEGSGSVAIVGTRGASSWGLEMATVIARDLASAGLVVVSGMARGCDSAAHRGALAAPGGRTVAVLGTGVDRVYPQENRALYDEIADKGLIISELPLGAPPLPHHFPLRNRIIAGMTFGVLVVEAPFKSGAMMTARCALEAGREVFSLPGRAGAEKSGGTNKLIKDGAALVESAADIIELLSMQSPMPVAAAAPRIDFTRALEPQEKAIMEMLAEDPLAMDEIIRRSGLGAHKTASILVQMELKDLVMQRPGNLYSRKF